MRKLTGGDLKELGLLKHYRIIRKWACKTNGITDADLELLIYFDCLGQFRKRDFEDGSLTYPCENTRWNRLLKEGWIVKWRGYNGSDISLSFYKFSCRCKCLIQQMYRIMLGEEDIPTSITNPYYANKSYTDKVMNKVIDDMIKDMRKQIADASPRKELEKMIKAILYNNNK